MSDNGSLIQKNISLNHHTNDHQNIHYLEDGTVEVIDTLSKEDYYKSLRRRGTESSSQNTRHHGLSSQLSLETSQGGTLRSGFGKRKRVLHDFKPCGKEEPCYVLMLEGVEKTFTIDKNAYGIHLFEKVCRQLDLQETEYFGLTYRTGLRVDNWLKLDKRIAKQVEKVPWKLEFRVRFYPPNTDEFKDDLTRYFFCLQLRQDIISGQLPCSHHTYVILGAFVVQSDAGDHDPNTHIGTDYIANIPFAPQQLQTSKMLQQIVELHKLHKGQSLVQADRGFLENARRLSLYGVEFHRAKTSTGESVCLGVYHDGILLYHGMLRMNRFLWPQIVKLLYKSKNFILVIRSMSKETLSKRGTLRRTFSPGGLKGSDRRENNSGETSHDITKKTMDSCTSQHAFFRLRDIPGPQRPNLTTAFSMRKYHFPSKTFDAYSREPSSEWIPRQQPPIKRVQTHRKPPQYTKTPSTSPPHSRNQVSGSVAPVAYGEEPDQYYIIPGSPSPLAANSVNVDVLQNLPQHIVNQAQFEYHYQKIIGKWWSTNDASLILGTDSKGFGYGADETGAGSAANPCPVGKFIHANYSFDYGMPIVPGDVIGCYLELNPDATEDNKRVNIHYSYNDAYAKYGILPAVSLKNARVELNFGDKPFSFPPKTTALSGKPWLAVSHVPSPLVICNQNVGWRVNPNDVTSSTNLLVSPNGRFVQAVENTGWQGFRVNKGILGDRAYYYEVRIVEDSGLARIGWSFENGSLDLGVDCFGYGYGADRDGFGINGSQGKKLHGDIIENYGEAFRKDDVIGCFIDLSNGIIQWSKNNRLFGPAYEIDKNLLKNNEPIYPAASLVDTTLELNYGDLPFKYPPEDDWTPLFAASDEYVYESAKWPSPNTIKLNSHPERPLLTHNLQVVTDPQLGNKVDIHSAHGKNHDTLLKNNLITNNSSSNDNSSSPTRREVRTFLETGDLITDNHFGSLCNAYTRHAATERSESEVSQDILCSSKLTSDKQVNETYHRNSLSNVHADVALEQAILQATHLNPYTAVLTNTVDIGTNNSHNLSAG
ncbi:unnamed protein product [Heterobilharzia americana]|nr:unnamed protein product [Heterobilharzia americana]